MRCAILVGALWGTLWLSAQPLAAQTQGKAAGAAKAAAKAATPERNREADEKSIRASAEAFAKAYNAHDAKALAGLFAADGEIVDEAGDAVQGRAAIEEVFAAVFETYPEGTMTVQVSAVRLIGSTLGIEEGVASVIHEPGDSPEDSRYSVVHMFQNGKWQIASVRDLSAEPPAANEELKALEPLIGEWVDESPEALVVTTYRWSDTHAYILSDFRIQVTGQEVMTGTQRIGWDPQAKVIRSWIFDSEGGFAEGRYGRDGDRWIIKLTGVNQDGETASATNSLTIVSKDQMVWQSRDRVVGGEAMPDSPEVTVVRTPPLPE